MYSYHGGYAHAGVFEEETVDQARMQYEPIAFGVMGTIQAVLPQMRKNHSGHIINISSMGGVQSCRPCPSIAVQKRLTKILAKGWSPK
ncbi:SDR family NAD(P)-dependent oxidoreductase [Cytobacillus purgationiresistens]|uniref:Short-subunit dehydrogenase n=1 Tax=Cytobacillus purgationiresistens TaxID=863449 RepID=A0ABU0AHQ5_9BACI|nr:SDR family NAD(P)-dependent oxidoreductase [Cytobacillus purgationiresistens]MDQ0269600.1 short-subunit dehydrogenase [Cytobacillus purgationiresistens]